MADNSSKLDILGHLCAQAMEHFSTVQIVATRANGDHMALAFSGRGCVFARAQSVREWLLRYDLQTEREIIREFDDG